MPTISVIIPAYNAEKTILKTIESVQQQTFSDFELIIVNNGSTDRTLELINSVIDKRLRIFSAEKCGVCRARNHGISHATGEFITFLDADDLWTPDKLELQLAALQQHPEAGVAYSWTHFIDEQDSFLFAHGDYTYEGNVYAHLLLTNFLANGSNPLIRRQAIDDVGQFDPALVSSGDWDFYLRLATGWHFVVVPKPQILYRQISGTSSLNTDVMERDSLIVIDRAFQSAPRELQFLKGQSLVNLYQYCAEKIFQSATNFYSECNVTAIEVMEKKIITKLENSFRVAPLERQLYKNQILAGIYQHCAEKCLLYSTNAKEAVNKAGQYLWLAIQLYPKKFREREAQNLFKWFLKQWMLMRLKGKYV